MEIGTNSGDEVAALTRLIIWPGYRAVAMFWVDDRKRRSTTTSHSNIELLVIVVITTHLDKASDFRRFVFARLSNKPSWLLGPWNQG